MANDEWIGRTALGHKFGTVASESGIRLRYVAPGRRNKAGLANHLFPQGIHQFPLISTHILKKL